MKNLDLNRDLITLLKNGDMLAFDGIYGHYFKRLYDVFAYLNEKFLETTLVEGKVLFRTIR